MPSCTHRVSSRTVTTAHSTQRMFPSMHRPCIRTCACLWCPLVSSLLCNVPLSRAQGSLRTLLTYGFSPRPLPPPGQASSHRSSSHPTHPHSSLLCGPHEPPSYLLNTPLRSRRPRSCHRSSPFKKPCIGSKASGMPLSRLCLTHGYHQAPRWPPNASCQPRGQSYATPKR